MKGLSKGRYDETFAGEDVRDGSSWEEPAQSRAGLTLPLAIVAICY